MASIERLRVTFTGTPFVGPSIATHYFMSGTVEPAAILQFWTNVKGIMPPGGIITVPNVGDVLNDTNGQVTGAWAASGGGTTTTSGSGTWVLGVGGRIVWETGALTNGRHVRGATYVVPLHAGAFDNTGRLTSAAVGVLQTSATTLLAAVAGDLVILTRQRAGVNGKSSVVVGSSVSEQPTWLRSRRV